MHSTRHAAEKDLIKRMLRFANLKALSDADQLAKILGPICANVNTISTEQLIRDQADFQKWLKKIASLRIVRGQRHLVWRIAALAEMLGFAEGCVVEIHVDFKKSSHLSESYSFRAASPEAACSYALALVIHRKKNWSRRLRQCEWDKCRNWFLSKPIRGGGSGERMCSAECRKASGNRSSKKSRSRGVLKEGAPHS
jgi:hypothetical protein